MKMKSLLLTTIATLGMTIMTMAQICFDPTINFGAVNTPYSIYSSDFNNDGNKDLVISQNSSYLLTVYYGNGDGTFGTANNISTSNSPAEIIGGDFNEDGIIDLATSGGVNNVWILLANGTGGFNSPTSFSASLFPSSLNTADFNNDGHLDLAVPNGNSANSISILLGSGTGTFGAPTDFPVGTCPCGNSCVKSADINSDGNIDLIVANQNSNDVSILLGSGNGVFGTPTNYSVGSSPWSVEIADFNSDTYIDIATSNQNSNNVSVLLGNNSGSFGLSTNYSVGNMPEQLKLADYDLDGNLDIATSDRNSNQISILTGTGAGTFNTAISFTVGNGPFALSNGDFNNDGKTDIATSNYGSNNISILLNCNCSIIFISQPTSLIVNSGANVQFAVSVFDLNATYQWQTDFGTGFQNISNVGQYSGVTNDTLTVSNVTMSNNNQPFRCIVSSGSCSDTSNAAVLTVNNTVGINENLQSNLFSVFPNPAQSVINVKADNKLIGEIYSIYDNTGRVVLTGKLNAESTTIELGNLSGGIYMFSVGENMKQTFKVIKE